MFEKGDNLKIGHKYTFLKEITKFNMDTNFHIQLRINFHKYIINL